MITRAKIEFKERIDELRKNKSYLEAFLIQSAYVESLLRRLFSYQLSLSVQSGGLRKAIKGKNLHLSTLMNFSFQAGWLSEPEHNNAVTYFGERNLIVHDLVASNSTDLNIRLDKLLTQGDSILEDHGSLEKFMGLAQQEYRRGKMTSTRESLDLSSREREIFELRLSGKTLEEVGEKFGITRERVRQIQNRAIQKMEGLVSTSVVNAVVLAKQQAETSKSVDAFIHKVCSAQRVTVEDLKGKSRKAGLVLVRHWIAYSLREQFKLSFPAIGRKLRRDHTTIIHAHNRIKALIEEGKIKT